jgi:hypothetical protein
MVLDIIDNGYIPPEEEGQPSKEDHYLPPGVDEAKTHEQARQKTKKGEAIIVVHDHRYADACKGNEHWLYVRGEQAHTWTAP